MNPKLSESETEACLEVLYRGLVQIRAAAGAGETELAETIANALHNLPHLLSTGDQTGRSLREFRKDFMGRLGGVYPDLFAHIAEPMLDLERRAPPDVKLP